MKLSTLRKMQTDGTLSEIQIMAIGCLIETRKPNGHRDLNAAAARLGQHYPDPYSNRLDYVTDMAEEADNREWN